MTHWSAIGLHFICLLRIQNYSFIFYYADTRPHHNYEMFKLYRKFETNIYYITTCNIIHHRLTYWSRISVNRTKFKFLRDIFMHAPPTSSLNLLGHKNIYILCPFKILFRVLYILSWFFNGYHWLSSIKLDFISF